MSKLELEKRAAAERSMVLVRKLLAEKEKKE